MPRPETKSVWACKTKPVVTDNDNSDSDTVDNLATAEQQSLRRCYPNKLLKRKKRHAKNLMSADTEDALIEWIRETPCLYQKGYRDTQKRSRLGTKKAAEMNMTGEYIFFNF